MTLTIAETVVVYAVGAALLAAWLDARRPEVRLKRAALHTAAALPTLYAMPYALAAVATGASSLRLAASLLLIVLPTLVYAFFGGFRLLRALLLYPASLR